MGREEMTGQRKHGYVFKGERTGHPLPPVHWQNGTYRACFNSGMFHEVAEHIDRFLNGGPTRYHLDPVFTNVYYLDTVKFRLVVGYEFGDVCNVLLFEPRGGTQ